jgi:hypothetical protein
MDIQAFEKFIKLEFDWKSLERVNNLGEQFYVDDDVDWMFIGWQACEKHYLQRGEKQADECLSLLNERNALLAVIAQKDEALKFYADRNNWHKDSQDYGSELSDFNIIYNDFYEKNQQTRYAGSKAQKALSLTPNNVRLVEVAKVVNGAYVSGEFNQSFTGSYYTIEIVS